MEQRDNLLRNVYIKAVLPNMIAILGGTINVFVDGILIGQKMGDIGIAAVNQSLAVYLIMCTIGSLFAAGASAESAYALGQREVEKARNYFSLALEAAFVISVFFCMAGILLSPTLAVFLGSESTKELIEIYIRITFVGGIFKIMLYIPYFYLRLEGKMKQAAFAMTLMTILNIVLDYVFLFPMNMGIAGTAWASVIATGITCILCFYLLCAKSDVFTFRPIKVEAKMLKQIFTSGSPMASNNLFSAIRIIALNAIMNLVGGSSVVTVFAITNNLNEFSICVQNGVPQTGSALLGVCNGENDNDAVKKLLLLQIKTGILISAVVTAFMIICSDYVGLIFGSKLDVKIAVIAWASSLIFATCNNVMNYYYYSIRQAKMANLITILRVFLVTVVVTWCLKDFGDGIWFFYPISELLTFVIWGLYGMAYAKKEKKENLLLLETSFGKSISFSISCHPEEICSVSAGVNGFCEEIGLDMQQTMTLSLAIEELLMITAEHTLHNKGKMDLRILQLKDGALLRIRAEGEPFNPLEHDSDDLDFMGVQMIKNMAARTEYQTTLGLNTLIVEI